MHPVTATIHVRRDQWHLAWDNTIPPIYRIRSGEVVAFDLLDAGCGQIGPDSTVAAIAALDFSRVDQVNGPIYVEGAEPGDGRAVHGFCLGDGVVGEAAGEGLGQQHQIGAAAQTGNQVAVVLAIAGRVVPTGVALDERDAQIVHGWSS